MSAILPLPAEVALQMGPARLELATSSLSATRSSQLSYEPVIDRAAPNSMSNKQIEATHYTGLKAKSDAGASAQSTDKEKAANKAVSGFGGTNQGTLGALRLTGFMLALWLQVFAQQTIILSERGTSTNRAVRPKS